MNFDPIPFNVLTGLGNWALIVGVTFALLFIVLLIGSLLNYGAAGPGLLLKQIKSAIGDWLSISPRRVGALTMLTFRESTRRKVFAVGVIFVLLIMFGGWFISAPGDQGDTQVKLLVSFILTAISWLILPVVVLLACWGLPEDIKARSLHTVVTKPVYRSEIVLGRIFGFTLIGTVALIVMGGAGYLWLNRQVVGENREALTARVPVYGNLSFLDSQGQPVDKGINVGDVWEFRSYIAGNSKARAIWEFTGIDESDLNPETNELQLESAFQVFRSYKGDLERGIRARYTFVNEDKDLRVSVPPFEVAEFRDGANVTKIPRTLKYRRDETVDLIDDLIDEDGNLKVEIECLDGGQFLGMARPDLFIRLPDSGFASGYFKALVSIWMMMYMAVVLCVALSCFVKGPVATLAAASILVVGKSFSSFLGQLATGKVEGGGLIESVYRIYTHTTPNVELQESTGRTVMKTIDAVPAAFIQLCQHVIPDFGAFDMTEYVANGFDVPFAAGMLPGIAIAIGHTLPWIFLAYVALKYRELEAK